MVKETKVNPRYGGETLADVKRERLKDPEYRLEWKIYDIAVEIGRIASQMRQRAGLTQAQVAEKMGVSQPVIARLESDQPERMPTLATFARYANACGYQVEIGFRPRRDNRNGDDPLFVITTQDYL